MSLEEITKAIEGGCFVFDKTHPNGWDFVQRYGRPVGYGYGDRFAVPLLYGDASDGKEGRLFILTGKAERSEEDPEEYMVEDVAALEFPSLRPCPDVRDIIFPPDRDKKYQILRLGGVRRIDSPGPDVASEMGKHMERAVSQPSGHDMQEKGSSVTEDFTELSDDIFFDHWYPLEAHDPATWEERDEARERMKRDLTPLDILHAFADFGADLNGALKYRVYDSDGNRTRNVEPLLGLQAYAGSLRLRAMEDVRDGMAQRRGGTVELCKDGGYYTFEIYAFADDPEKRVYSSLSYDDMTGASGGNRIRTEIEGPADFLAPVFEAIGRSGLKDTYPGPQYYNFAAPFYLEDLDHLGEADILTAGKALDDLYGVFRGTVERLMDTPLRDFPEDVCISMTDLRRGLRNGAFTMVSRTGIETCDSNGILISETEAREGGPALTAAGARREFERLLSAGDTKPSRASDRKPPAMER